MIKNMLIAVHDLIRRLQAYIHQLFSIIQFGIITPCTEDPFNGSLYQGYEIIRHEADPAQIILIVCNPELFGSHDDHTVTADSSTVPQLCHSRNSPDIGQFLIRDVCTRVFGKRNRTTHVLGQVISIGKEISSFGVIAGHG